MADIDDAVQRWLDSLEEDEREVVLSEVAPTNWPGPVWFAAEAQDLVEGGPGPGTDDQASFLITPKPGALAAINRIRTARK